MEASVNEEGFLVPESKETKNKALSALQVAQAWLIADTEGFTKAAAFRDGLKAIEREINDTFDGPIAAAFKAHKAIVAAKKTYSDPLEAALRTIKGKLIVYDEEQKRIARLEQIRLEAEAKKKAEEEALELATLLEEAGQSEAAAEVIEAPVQVAPIAVQKSTPKIEGFSYRSNWKVEIQSVNAMLMGWKEGKVPSEAFQGDAVFLRSEAMRLKAAAIGRWPGVRCWEEKV